METAGAYIVLLGSVSFFISALGLLRMPDIYNRIQVGTKATTFGTMLMMIGFSLLHPQWAPKLVLLIIFIFLTNPISSHVIARAAHFNEEKQADITIKDNLTQKKEGI